MSLRRRRQEDEGAVPQFEDLSQWVTIFRDVVIVLLATFLMVFAVVKIHDPTALGLVLGAGATMLGVPPFLRVRESAKQTNDSEEDKWSHLP